MDYFADGVPYGAVLEFHGYCVPTARNLMTYSLHVSRRNEDAIPIGRIVGGQKM